MTKQYSIINEQGGTSTITFSAEAAEDMSMVTPSGVVSYDQAILENAYDTYKKLGGMIAFNRFVEKIVGIHFSSECNFHGVYGDIVNRGKNEGIPSQFVVEKKV
jgi:hypothetical protein